MSEPRLSPAIEASSFLRQAEVDGGFGAILHRGDSDRGTLLIVVVQRGQFVTCLARELGLVGYRWHRVGPAVDEPDKLELFLEKRRRNDPDEWQIELDIPSAERFIAATTELS